VRLVTQRRVAIVVGVGLALALAWTTLRPRPIPVDVAAVSRGDLRVTVDEEGKTRVRDRYVVATPADGRLLRLALKEGDAVEQGSVLARLQPASLDPRTRAAAESHLEAARDRKREADANVSRARAALVQARRSASRAEKLLLERMISPEAAEQSTLAATTRAEELAAAESAAEAAGHDLEVARAALLGDVRGMPGVRVGDCGSDAPCLELYAPVTGQVLRVLQESERTVTAGTPLLEIGDARDLEIVADVLSTDAVKVKLGAAVLADDWGGGTTLRARVRRVEPSGFTKLSALGVEEQRVNVIADFDDPPGPLGDGYRIEVRIVVWEGEDVLRVPASALFRHADAWHVFVVERGRARRRAVNVGARGTLDAEVLGGLASGEIVILHPSDRIDDGVRVAARDARAS
jgi:HlyD family secretion protein